MYAVEFDTISKDGVIYIPSEFREELGNREAIRLIVMYDIPAANNVSNELIYLEKLFSNSNNEIKVINEIAINTDEMIDDIS